MARGLRRKASSEETELALKLSPACLAGFPFQRPQYFGQCSGWSHAMVLVSATKLRALGKRARVNHDFWFVVKACALEQSTGNKTVMHEVAMVSPR